MLLFCIFLAPAAGRETMRGEKANTRDSVAFCLHPQQGNSAERTSRKELATRWRVIARGGGGGGAGDANRPTTVSRKKPRATTSHTDGTGAPQEWAFVQPVVSVG